MRDATSWTGGSARRASATPPPPPDAPRRAALEGGVHRDCDSCTIASVLLRLDRTEGALHERIAAAVRRSIAEGEVSRGDRLPATRDLAVQLDLNVNTVLRAYRTLQDEGLVELRRGRGAVVVGEPNVAALIGDLDRLIATADHLGVARARLRQLLEERL